MRLGEELPPDDECELPAPDLKTARWRSAGLSKIASSAFLQLPTSVFMSL